MKQRLSKLKALRESVNAACQNCPNAAKRKSKFKIQNSSIIVR